MANAVERWFVCSWSLAINWAMRGTSARELNDEKNEHHTTLMREKKKQTRIKRGKAMAVQCSTEAEQWATGNPRERLSGWWNHHGFFIRTRVGGRAIEGRVRTRTPLQERNERRKKSHSSFPEPSAVKGERRWSVVREWVGGWVGRLGGFGSTAALTAWGKIDTRRKATHPDDDSLKKGVFFSTRTNTNQQSVGRRVRCRYNDAFPASFNYLQQQKWTEQLSK